MFCFHKPARVREESGTGEKEESGIGSSDSQQDWSSWCGLFLSQLVLVKENKHVPPIKVKKHLFCTLILLILLYGWETWTVKVFQMQYFKCSNASETRPLDKDVNSNPWSRRKSRDNGFNGLAMSPRWLPYHKVLLPSLQEEKWKTKEDMDQASRKWPEWSDTQPQRSQNCRPWSPSMEYCLKSIGITMDWRCGANTTSLLKLHTNKLLVFQMLCLCQILRISIWGHLQNKTIRLTCEPKIEKKIQRWLLWWVSHVCRMNISWQPCRLFWRQRSGRPKMM